MPSASFDDTGQIQIKFRGLFVSFSAPLQIVGIGAPLVLAHLKEDVQIVHVRIIICLYLAETTEIH